MDCCYCINYSYQMFGDGIVRIGLIGNTNSYAKLFVRGVF